MSHNQWNLQTSTIKIPLNSLVSEGAKTSTEDNTFTERGTTVTDMMERPEDDEGRFVVTYLDGSRTRTDQPVLTNNSRGDQKDDLARLMQYPVKFDASKHYMGPPTITFEYIKNHESFGLCPYEVSITPAASVWFEAGSRALLEQYNRRNGVFASTASGTHL